jgi:hypothetical protein
MKRFCLLLILILSFSALAEAADIPDIYKIKNIRIENKADDLATAKQTAIDAGKKEAFENLMKRFVNYGYIAKAPVIDFKQIDDALDNFLIIEEVNIDTKYEARMNYEFSPEKILKILNLPSINSLPEKDAFLLVPVLKEGLKITPWSPIWFDTWKKMKIDSVTIPLGDLEDLKVLNGEDLSNLNYTGLDILARRYKSPIVVMAEAEYDVPKNILTISLIRFEEEPKKVAEYKYPGSFGIGSKELFMTAANDISNIIKSSGIPRTGEELENPLLEKDIEIQYTRDYQSDSSAGKNSLTAKVITRSLADWSAYRRKLINSTLIDKIMVNSFSATETNISLYYIGEIQELQRSLSNIGLNLTEQDGEFIIDRVQN